MLKGRHLIAGEWIGSDVTFTNAPVSGAPDAFAVGTPAHVERAVQAAEMSFESYRAMSRADRAAVDCH